MRGWSRGTVAREIRDSLLKEVAAPNKPALYWSQEEQEEKLEATYEKWLLHGGIWSAAAPKVRRIFDQKESTHQ